MQQKIQIDVDLFYLSLGLGAFLLFMVGTFIITLLASRSQPSPRTDPEKLYLLPKPGGFAKKNLSTLSVPLGSRSLLSPSDQASDGAAASVSTANSKEASTAKVVLRGTQYFWTQPHSLLWRIEVLNRNMSSKRNGTTLAPHPVDKNGSTKLLSCVMRTYFRIFVSAIGMAVEQVGVIEICEFSFFPMKLLFSFILLSSVPVNAFARFWAWMKGSFTNPLPALWINAQKKARRDACN